MEIMESHIRNEGVYKELLLAVCGGNSELVDILKRNSIKVTVYV